MRCDIWRTLYTAKNGEFVKHCLRQRFFLPFTLLISLVYGPAASGRSLRWSTWNVTVRQKSCECFHRMVRFVIKLLNRSVFFCGSFINKSVSESTRCGIIKLNIEQWLIDISNIHNTRRRCITAEPIEGHQDMSCVTLPPTTHECSAEEH